MSLKSNQSEPLPEDYLNEAIKILNTLCIEKPDAIIETHIDVTKMQIAIYLIKRAEIEKTMNDIGVKHPSRLGFIKGVLES